MVTCQASLGGTFFEISELCHKFWPVNCVVGLTVDPAKEVNITQDLSLCRILFKERHSVD